MKDPMFPPRLTEGPPNELVRGLLQAGKRDGAEPPQAQLLVAKYMDARAQSAIDGALRPATSWLRLSPKLFGSIALVGAISLGWAVRHSMDGPATTPSPSPETASPAVREPVAPVTLAAPPRVTSDAPSVRVDELPTAAVSENPPSRPATIAPREPALPSTGVTRSGPGSLADELALVEDARASLSRSDPKECLRSLDAYDRRFRGGVLGHEVAAMRIEALASEGQRERARALGEAFLAANPSSPYASRIQSILAATP